MQRLKMLAVVSFGLAMLGLSGLASADGTSAQRIHARYVAAQAGQGAWITLANGLIVPAPSDLTAKAAHHAPAHLTVADCLAGNSGAQQAN